MSCFLVMLHSAYHIEDKEIGLCLTFSLIFNDAIITGTQLVTQLLYAKISFKHLCGILMNWWLMLESVVSLGVVKWLFSNSIISSTFILNPIKKIVHQQRKLEPVGWAMFWMFRSPPNHVPSVTVFGNGFFVKLLDHEGETLMNRIIAHIWRGQRTSSLLSTMWGYKKMTICKPGNGPS